jgi:hypothetical protein
MTGSGRQDGRLREEYGANHAELTCDACEASWVGPIGEVCAWCLASEDNQRRWQADKTLTPPGVERDDEGYEGAMTAWAKRMAVAVEADIITRAQAQAARRREVAR